MADMLWTSQKMQVKVSESRFETSDWFHRPGGVWFALPSLIRIGDLNFTVLSLILHNHNHGNRYLIMFSTWLIIAFDIKIKNRIILCKHFKYYLPLKNRIILCKHFKVSNNILFWYKCEDLQCIDLFGINQNVAQKYSPNCAIQFSKFKNLPASEGAHPPSDTPLCAQARNWRWRATRSSPPPPCSKRIYAPGPNSNRRTV